jgi:hypothetical protein
MTHTITSQDTDLSCRITLYMVTVSTNFVNRIDLVFGQNCQFSMVSDYSLVSDKYWIQQSLTYKCLNTQIHHCTDVSAGGLLSRMHFSLQELIPVKWIKHCFTQSKLTLDWQGL